jgi:hypothetical protein
MKRRRWYYKLPGSFYAFGPTNYDKPVSRREVRAMILRSYYPQRKRLPAYVDVYPAGPSWDSPSRSGGVG